MRRSLLFVSLLVLLPVGVVSAGTLSVTSPSGTSGTGASPPTACTTDGIPSPPTNDSEAKPQVDANAADTASIVAAEQRDHWSSSHESRGYGVGTSFNGGADHSVANTKPSTCGSVADTGGTEANRRPQQSAVPDPRNPETQDKRSGIDVDQRAAAHPRDRLIQHERAGIGVGNPSALVADNFDILGHSNLVGGSPDADVWFYNHGGTEGKHAYVGTWSGVCSGTGVKIVDVNDPTRPKLVAIAGKQDGVSTEDIVVRRIGTRDVLGIGVQDCKPGRAGGLELWDVTDPSRPTKLSFLPLPPGGVHELDLVVRADGKALALLAVPFAEFFSIYFGLPFGGDFRIVDITDPSSPVELANWGIVEDSNVPIVAGIGPITSPFQGIGYFAAYYDHSVRAADGGNTAYVSYWDGGVLKFNISNPANPVLVGRTTYSFDAEGDAHSLAVLDVGGQRYLLQNDEDFTPLSPAVVTSSATGLTQYAGIEELWAPTLLSGVGTITDSVFDAGDGCETSDYAGSVGKIVLADSVDPFYVGIIPGWAVPCSIGEQTLLAADAGATAFVSNLVSPDDAYPYFDGDLRAVRRRAVGMPVVQIADIDGLTAAIRAAGGPVTLTLAPRPPHLGFVRVFRESPPTGADADGVLQFGQVGQFEIPGESVHNTEVHGNRAYSSWYSQGIVALDVSSPATPVQVGQFVPSTSNSKAGSLGPGPALVWGLAIDPATGIIYVSEMRTGLWIVRPTGPAATP